MTENHFSSQTLGEIFRDIFLEERSGVLELARAEVEKKVYFDRGMILFTESSLEQEQLGRRLVEEGKLSPGALAEALRNISEPKGLAQTLINRGLIGKETLSHTVKFLVEKVVQSLFSWEGGTARFSDGWLLQETFEGDVVTTFDVITKGISSMVGFEPVRNALKAMDRPLRVCKPTPVPLERLTLSPAHGFILSQLDGTTSVDNVVSILPPAEEDLACRFLFSLLIMGVTEFDPPLTSGPFRVSAVLKDHADQAVLEKLQQEMIGEFYENLKNKIPCEVLGVQPGAPRAEVEEAYATAKGKVDRDRLVPKVREQMREQLAVIESRLLEAYLTLSQAGLRRGDGQPGAEQPTEAGDLLVRVENDRTKTQIAAKQSERQAEDYYLKARTCLRERDYHNAIQYGKLAITYKPEDARFYFLVGDCQSRNPESRWQRMAEQSYLKAAELDPWNAEYVLTLGRFYKKRGMKLRARKHFERVLEIVPSHELAVEELSALR